MNPKGGTEAKDQTGAPLRVTDIKQIRSSAWLEHYTDNVGVSSSNLLGSTKISKSDKVNQSESQLTNDPLTKWGVSSAG